MYRIAFRVGTKSNATTIFSAKQRCNIVATLFGMTLFQHCNAVLRERAMRIERNAALQCWNNAVTTQNNVATMLQRCVSLKIVVATRPRSHHL